LSPKQAPPSFQLLRSQPESAAEISEAVGVTRSSLSRYRRGRGLPSIGALGRLLSRCGISLGQFEDLLLDARGDGPSEESEEGGGLPRYIPLGLLVVPPEDQAQQPEDRDIERYLRRLLAHYRPALKAKAKDKGSADR
jgi:transcriptional regulator with XRE-family HTH domain